MFLPVPQAKLRGLLMRVASPAILAIVFTLGLAIPWAAHRWFTLVANTTVYPRVIDSDELVSIHDAGASALLEGVGEAGEALSDLGDFFGG